MIAGLHAQFEDQEKVCTFSLQTHGGVEECGSTTYHGSQPHGVHHGVHPYGGTDGQPYDKIHGLMPHGLMPVEARDGECKVDGYKVDKIDQQEVDKLASLIALRDTDLVRADLEDLVRVKEQMVTELLVDMDHSDQCLQELSSQCEEFRDLHATDQP